MTCVRIDSLQMRQKLLYFFAARPRLIRAPLVLRLISPPKRKRSQLLLGVILFSWLLAFFEYCFQVPANRIGFRDNGGPFSLIQLKVIQEVITLVVFVVFSTLAFKGETLKWNHALAFVFLVAAVYLVFKK